MATISGATNERVYSIPKWLGLNEHPDGDTRLKTGEAAKMVNWRITRDGNLKRRPGTEFVIGVADSYSVSRSTVLSPLGSYQASDKVTAYTQVSANTVKGKLTVTTGEGKISLGVHIDPDASVSGGVGTYNTGTWAVSDGVLVGSGSGTVYTMAELLETVLPGLGTGVYLYVVVDELTYAIDSSCLSYDDFGNYILGGYRLRAVPTTPENSEIRAMWTGVVAGKDCFLVACQDGLWSLWDAVNGVFSTTFIGTCKTDKGFGFFPFDGKVYILNGYEYYCWDGTNLTTVHGYRPLVAISIGPVGTADAGELTGEYVNRLNGERRVWISPDGTNKTFQLPEKGLSAIDYITDLSDGSTVSSGYTYNLTDGTVTFSTAPAQAVNKYEIGYSVATTYRTDVTGNLYAELYSGTTDTRVFIYGDGTNRALYSGMDYDGMPRADYFPDQYEVRIGDSNTPITGMIRHYGALIAYKPNECWSLQHGIVELANSDLTPAVYCVPVNREKGNIAPGQVRLVENSPVTCSGTELYQWGSVSRYSSGIGRDERNAKRISDRVQRSIKDFDFTTACMWDDNDHQEFYIVQNKIALVWNYAADAWYRYENFDAAQICSFRGEVYIGTSEGKVMRVTEEVKGDDGEKITAEWESGAMDFGADYMRKYSSMVWVGLKPVSGTSVDVTLKTDRKDTFLTKTVSAEKAKVAGEPFMVKTKLKAKKFEYYRLNLSVSKKMPPVTVVNVDFRVRQTGYAK